jgi:hypothetical protein
MENNRRKTITNRTSGHASRHSAITSIPTVLRALKKALQELLGSGRWHGSMPKGCMVVWIMALKDGRKEAVVTEELIYKRKEERKRRERKRERKQKKEQERKEKNAELRRDTARAKAMAIADRQAMIITGGTGYA